MAAAAIGLGVPAFWTISRRGDDDVPQHFVVAPGDDPSAFSLPVEDAHLIEIDRSGDLLVHVGPRVRRLQKPHAYQDFDGRRRDVSVRFDLAATGDPRLAVGPYDRTVPLVIDVQPGKDDLQP